MTKKIREELNFEENFSEEVAATLSAAGTTIADATDLTAKITNVSTVASGAGVQLTMAVGQSQVLRNSGANALLVYPTGSGVKINGGTDGAAVSVAATELATFYRVSATNIIGGVAVVF